jgi:hypothetical protein
MAYNGSQFFLADQGRNRILVWNTFPTQQFAQPADHVIGQPDFSSSAALVGPALLNGIVGLTTYGTHLAGADMGNERVVIY